MTNAAFLFTQELEEIVSLLNAINTAQERLKEVSVDWSLTLYDSNGEIVGSVGVSETGSAAFFFPTQD